MRLTSSILCLSGSESVVGAVVASGFDGGGGNRGGSNRPSLSRVRLAKEWQKSENFENFFFLLGEGNRPKTTPFRVLWPFCCGHIVVYVSFLFNFTEKDIDKKSSTRFFWG